MSGPSNVTFCDLENFGKSYKTFHGPASLFVCVFGSIANVLNICVLTTKEMRWPTNLILTGLAVADLMVMLEYIPFTVHTNFNQKKIENYNYNWAVFTVFHALFSQVFHFISCCLTVLLAVWRYVTITYPHSSRFWCSMKKTFYIIVATYIVCPIICSPIFLAIKIHHYNQTCTPDGTIVNKVDLNTYKGPLEKRTIYYTSHSDLQFKNISFWIYGVVIKLVPCLLLTFLSWRLISVLVETKKRRKMLLNSGLPLKELNPEKCTLKKKTDKDKQADRTSGMLVAVLLLFLLTEFPQAILGLLSAIIGEKFEEECYNCLGDVMDTLALTNSAINFILYCTMSRQFRSTFKQFFRPKIFKHMPMISQQSMVEKNNEKTQMSQA